MRTAEININTIQNRLNRAKTKADEVLLDLSMPYMDGLETLKKLIEIGLDAKAIMVTAVRQQSSVEKATEYGAKDYVLKPFNTERIVITFDRITE